jgi:flavin-dependent dehydrogenase
MRERTQVLVVGGGPAGSTAAGFLAREGFQVTLLERDRFPRYHIGESILPSCLPILNLLGAREKIEQAGFRRKGGAYFAWGPDTWEMRFAELGAANGYAWQVVRSEFDQILLDHARDCGVEVHEGTAVRGLRFEGGRPVSAQWAQADRGRSGTIDYDFLVDASGRAGLLAVRHFRMRRMHDVFKNVAVWSYWRDVPPFPDGPDGATLVCSVTDGWFWVIPLADGTTSVGLVTGKDAFAARRTELGGTEALYAAALRDSPTVANLLAGARRVSDIRTETDYSYVSSRFSGPGYVMTGDAACFLDPLLSTGVHLATYSAMLAAASISSALRGEVTEPEALDFYSAAYRTAYERLLVLVSVFYEAYRGREHHFYTAQRLSRRERGELSLHTAFLNIISGIEDLQDAKDAAYEAVVEGLSKDGNPFATFVKGGARQVPFTPENAVGNIYLRLQPSLGLERVAATATRA